MDLSKRTLGGLTGGLTSGLAGGLTGGLAGGLAGGQGVLSCLFQQSGSVGVTGSGQGPLQHQHITHSVSVLEGEIASDHLFEHCCPKKKNKFAPHGFPKGNPPY